MTTTAVCCICARGGFVGRALRIPRFARNDSGNYERPQGRRKAARPGLQRAKRNADPSPHPQKARLRPQHTQLRRVLGTPARVRDDSKGVRFAPGGGAPWATKSEEKSRSLGPCLRAKAPDVFVSAAKLLIAMTFAARTSREEGLVMTACSRCERAEKARRKGVRKAPGPPEVGGPWATRSEEKSRSLGQLQPS